MLRRREHKEGCQSRQRNTRKSRHNSEDSPASEGRWEKRTTEKRKLKWKKRIWHLRWEMQRETAEWTLGKKRCQFLLNYSIFLFYLFIFYSSPVQQQGSSISNRMPFGVRQILVCWMSLVNWWRFNLYFIDECWRWLLGNSQTSKQVQQNKTN